MKNYEIYIKNKTSLQKINILIIEFNKSNHTQKEQNHKSMKNQYVLRYNKVSRKLGI